MSAKMLIFFAKSTDLSLNAMLLLFGKRRTLVIGRTVEFDNIWKKYLNLYKKIHTSSTLLKFRMPKYDFEFFGRPNSDDFKVMTLHEDEIIQHIFAPKEGDTVVDIGAHIGLYTILASKRVGPKGKVIAIEADPSNFDVLVQNIHLNKLTNVIALNYAVYSEEKKMRLYLPTEGGVLPDTKYNTLMLERAHRDEKFVEVTANTLDNLLSQLKQEQVNWIKIDVEGAELEVLKGCESVLSKSNDISLLIEVHILSDNANLYRPVCEFIGKYNFTIEFNKRYESGEMHVLARKQKSLVKVGLVH